MTIHHATVKRAASLGVILTEENGEAVAFYAQRNKTIRNADPKVAVFLVQLAAKLSADWSQVTLDDSGAAYVADDAIWDLADFATEDGGDWDLNSADALDAAFAEIVDAIPEGSEAEDDEEGEPVVVVAERYKAEYKARGDASGCGDWLHVTLKRYSSEAEDVGGKTVKLFDEPGFTAMLVANGIEIKGKFAAMPDSGSKGWEGRYRMNGRQMLEAPLLRAKGVLQLEDGTEVTMPSEDYDDLLALPRHRALREAIETAEAEAEAEAEAKATRRGEKGRK